MFTVAAAKLMASAVALATAAMLWTGLARQDQYLLDMPMQRIVLSPERVIEAGIREVTVSHWTKCVDAGACEALRRPPATDSSPWPMTGVNRLDVDDYIAWLNGETGLAYRLPTAEEWQSLAEDLPRPSWTKLFDDPRMAWAADYGRMRPVPARLRPSGSFGRFSNGLEDLSGNVWEWTSTCAARGFDAANCPAYVVEGAHRAVLSIFVRDPASGGCSAGVPPANIGFRLVRDL
jgi:formylglycine-generating enzyme required for sulfatase activity